MTIYLKDEATSKAVRKLAKLRGTTLTEAVRSAVAEALSKENEPKRRERVFNEIKALQDKFAKRPKTGLKADKAFFDELSGDI
jgi:antitoxin VapB